MLIYFIFLIFTIETKKKKIRCPNCNVPFPYSPIQKFVNFGKPSSFPPLCLDVICLWFLTMKKKT